MMSVQVPAAGRAGNKADGSSWPFNLDGVIAVGVLYGLVYSCLRLLVSDNLPVDDVKANVYTQTLELGYMPKQPPLFEWLLWLVQNVTGPTLPSFLILRYGLLAATFAFLYLVAVVWREGAANRLSKAEKRELATVLGGLTATPERVRVPWRPYPPTSAERVWTWMVVVADSPPPE